MKISKIQLQEVKSKQNKTSNKQSNPFYLNKNNNLQDSISFSGSKKSFRNNLAARVATIMLAVSSIFGSSGCTPQNNTKPVETQNTIESSYNANTTEAEKEIESLIESVNEQKATPYYIKSSQLALAEFDYTNVLENDIRLVDHLKFDEDTTKIFNLDEISPVKRFNDDNIGSATVLTTINRKNKTSEVENGFYVIPDNDEAFSVSDLIDDAYKNLSENERNSAAWAIMDNNEEVLKEVNYTYLTVQIAERFKRNLGMDGSESWQTEQNIPNYALSAIKDIARNNFNYDNDEYGFLAYDESAWVNISQSEKTKMSNIKAKLEELNQEVNYSTKQEFKTIDETTKPETIPTEIIFMTDLSKIEDKEVVTPALHTLTNVGKYGTKYIQDVGFSAKWYDLKLEGNEKLTLDEAKVEIANAIGQQYAGKDGKELLKDSNENYILSSYAGQNILKTILLEKTNNELFDGVQINKVNDVIEILANKMIDGEDITLSTPDTTLSFIYKNQLNDPVSYAVAKRNVEFSYLHVDKTAVALSELQELAQAENREEATALDLLNYVEYNGTSLKEAIINAKGTSRYDELVTLGASAITQLAETNPKIFNNIISNARFTPNQLLDVKVSAPYVNGSEVEDYTIQLENIVYMNEVATKKIQKTPSSSIQVIPEIEEDAPSNTPSIEPTPTQAPTVAPKPTAPSYDDDDDDYEPDPTPTTPRPTTPKPTNPEPTVPQPTDPQPTLSQLAQQVQMFQLFLKIHLLKKKLQTQKVIQVQILMMTI